MKSLERIQGSYQVFVFHSCLFYCRDALVIIVYA